MFFGKYNASNLYSQSSNIMKGGKALSYQDIQQLEERSFEEILNTLILLHCDELKRMAYLYLNDLTQRKILFKKFLSLAIKISTSLKINPPTRHGYTG